MTTDEWEIPYFAVGLYNRLGAKMNDKSSYCTGRKAVHGSIRGKTWVFLHVSIRLAHKKYLMVKKGNLRSMAKE